MINFFKKKENQKEIESELRCDVAELDKIAKMLVRRDFELTLAREKLEEAKTVLEIKVRARTKELEELTDNLDKKIKIKTKALTKALKEVEEEKNRTLTIINNFKDGLLVFNEKNKLVLFNPQAEEIIGFPRDKFINKSIVEISSLTGFDFLKKIKDKPFFREPFKIRQDLVIELSTVEVGERNKKGGFMIILHDVTREKRIESMKNEFVSLAAHQLRTPLSAIKWTLKMLLDGDLGKINEEQRDFINKTYNSNERMIHLINDLLNVARIEEGKYILRQSSVKIEEIVEFLVDLYQKKIKEKKIKFSFRKPKKKLPELFVDKEKIQLAIENLLENALKYTSLNGEIIITLKKEKDRIKFFIRDSGVGIPEEQQNRIFSKFFRAGNIIRMETEGTGLGLFIAKNIIEAHGGKIWFKSKEGEGTIFCFTLPLEEKLGDFLVRF